MLALDNHPGHIATGFAIGVFISITPFIGLHTVMAVMAAFTFRLNKLTTITGAWINTPITVPPVLIACYKLGAWLLGETARPFNVTSLEWDYLKDFAGALMLGSAVIGLMAALAGYGFCYWLIIRFRRNTPVMAELTRESILAGEDLDPLFEAQKTCNHE